MPRGENAAGAQAVRGPQPRASELDAALGPRVGGEALSAPLRCLCARRAPLADQDEARGQSPITGGEEFNAPVGPPDW
jgi:hypothetical protein